MTVNDLIKKLDELKGRDLDNGDLPIVLGFAGETMPDEVFVEHHDGDPRLPFVRICSIKDERLGPAAFGRLRSARKHKRPCGNPDCAVSSGIHEGLTFGSGTLDFNGFWSNPCAICARAHERRHPEVEPCWPFADGEEPSPEASGEAAR